ncbi:MAG: hypothetical protein ACLVB1_10505 [Blautia obeum]
MTEGEFAGILDHDDLLAPNALYEIALALEKIRNWTLFIRMKIR